MDISVQEAAARLHPKYRLTNASARRGAEKK